VTGIRAAARGLSLAIPKHTVVCHQYCGSPELVCPIGLWTKAKDDDLRCFEYMCSDSTVSEPGLHPCEGIKIYQASCPSSWIAWYGRICSLWLSLIAKVSTKHMTQALHISRYVLNSGLTLLGPNRVILRSGREDITQPQLKVDGAVVYRLWVWPAPVAGRAVASVGLGLCRSIL
jgi:hypothetical protein